MEPDHCGLQYLQEKPTEAENDPNKAPIHIERAKVVQRIFDLSIKVERKVLQAEYVSPWQYARYSSGIHAAVRRINAIDPDTRLSVAGYETILASVKRRVERAFR
jgi:hypothetical protein